MTAIDPQTLTLGGLFVAGLATTLHCAGMCGLLTCGLGIAGKGPALASVGLYHAFRLLGYSTAGGIMGWIGGRLGLEVTIAGISWLPLLLIIFLFAVVLGLDKKLGAIPGVGKVMMQIRMRTLKFSQPVRASVIGFATPLLPCGPLYAIMGLSLASGSAIRGVEIMLAFGLGAIPGIWAVQVGSSWMSQKLGAKGFLIAKKSLACIAAVSLLWHFSFIGAASTGEGADGSSCRCDLELGTE